MNETYVPPRVRLLDGHDLFDEEPGCEIEACPNDATFLREATWELDGALLCETHARAFVHREALERIAYPTRHPKRAGVHSSAEPGSAAHFYMWATSVASNALSFGRSSYVPADRVGDDGDREERDAS